MEFGSAPPNYGPNQTTQSLIPAIAGAYVNQQQPGGLFRQAQTPQPLHPPQAQPPHQALMYSQQPPQQRTRLMPSASEMQRARQPQQQPHPTSSSSTPTNGIPFGNFSTAGPAAVGTPAPGMTNNVGGQSAFYAMAPQYGQPPPQGQIMMAGPSPGFVSSGMNPPAAGFANPNMQHMATPYQHGGLPLPQMPPNMVQPQLQQPQGQMQLHPNHPQNHQNHQQITADTFQQAHPSQYHVPPHALSQPIPPGQVRPPHHPQQPMPQAGPTQQFPYQPTLSQPLPHQHPQSLTLQALPAQTLPQQMHLPQQQQQPQPQLPQQQGQIPPPNQILHQFPSAAPHPGQMAPRTPSRNTSISYSPLSPSAIARERDRVSLLLDINLEIFQELVSLQAQGKGGANVPGPPSGREEDGVIAASPKMADLGDMSKPASKEFADCMRRLHANLSYLVAAVERPNKLPPGPAVMDSPMSVHPLKEMYGKLQLLFPGWQGQPSRPPSMAFSFSPNPVNASLPV